MTVCRFTQKVHDISFLKKPDELVKADRRKFTVIYMKGGVLRCMINGVDCYLNGKNILCLSDQSQWEIIKKYNFDAIGLSFSPSFINVNLEGNMVHSATYVRLCRTCGYPAFQPFLCPPCYKASLYCGVIPLMEEMALRAGDILAHLERQLRIQPDQRWSCRARSWLFELLDLLQYGYEAAMNETELDELIPKVLAYITAHLNENLTIERLGKVYGVNHTTLTKQFRESTGKSINVYINEKRLEIVKSQLAFTELSLKEIAFINGYSTSPYLVRVFKAKTGMTPLEYRKKMQQIRLQK